MDEQTFDTRAARLLGRILDRIVNMDTDRKVDFLSGHEPGQGPLLRHLASELREAAEAIDEVLSYDAGWASRTDQTVACYHQAKEHVAQELADVMVTLACANAEGRDYEIIGVRDDLHLDLTIPKAIGRPSHPVGSYIARSRDGGPSINFPDMPLATLAWKRGRMENTFPSGRGSLKKH